MSIAHDRKGDVVVVVFVGTRVVLRSSIFLEWILPAQSVHENENENENETRALGACFVKIAPRARVFIFLGACFVEKKSCFVLGECVFTSPICSTKTKYFVFVFVHVFVNRLGRPELSSHQKTSTISSNFRLHVLHVCSFLRRIVHNQNSIKDF